MASSKVVVFEIGAARVRVGVGGAAAPVATLAAMVSHLFKSLPSSNVAYLVSIEPFTQEEFDTGVSSFRSFQTCAERVCVWLSKVYTR